MNVAFNGNNYPVSGTSFNISLGTITNPNSLADNTSVPISIKNNDFIAYSSQLTFAPTLTSQNLTAFTSLNVPITMNVSQNYNITLTLSNYSITYISVILPPFIKSLSMCCIDSACSQSNISSCNLTNTSDNKINLNLVLKTSQNVSNITFRVVALDYQINYTNSLITINSGLPSATLTTSITVSVVATQLQSSLALSSWKVSTPSSYNLWIAPISQSGYIGISLPSYITLQLTNSSASYTFNVNGVVTNVSLQGSGTYTFLLPITSLTVNITLVLSSVINPANSAPFNLSIYQGFDNALTKIAASNTFQIAMNQFDLITVSSVMRSITKVAQLTSLTMKITTPQYTENMTINFPTSQQFTNNTCSVVANGQNLGCQILNSTAILTTNLPGTYTYTITGLYNQRYFILSASTDLVQVSLGNPYTRAQTTSASTSYITPTLTLGSITMLSQSTSSSVSLSQTSLFYNFTI